MTASLVVLLSGLVVLVGGSYVPYQAGVSHGAPVGGLPQGRSIVQPPGSVVYSHGALATPVGGSHGAIGSVPRRQAGVSYSRPAPAIPVALASPHPLTGGFTAPRRQASIIYSRPTAILSASPANPRPLAATRRQSSVSYNRPATIGIPAAIHGRPGNVTPIRQPLGASGSGYANPHQYRHNIQTPH